MKIFRVSYDTICITLIAEDKEDVMKLLNEEEKFYATNDYTIENGVMYYNFGPSVPLEPCNVEEISFERGIIQFEAH